MTHRGIINSLPPRRLVGVAESRAEAYLFRLIIIQIKYLFICPIYQMILVSTGGLDYLTQSRPLPPLSTPPWLHPVDRQVYPAPCLLV